MVAKSKVGKVYQEGGREAARDLLINAYAQHHDVKKAAESLGMTQPSFSYWMLKLDLVLISALVVNGEPFIAEATYAPTPKALEFLASG